MTLIFLRENQVMIFIKMILKFSMITLVGERGRKEKRRNASQTP